MKKYLALILALTSTSIIAADKAVNVSKTPQMNNKSGKYVFVETGQRIKIKKANKNQFTVTVYRAHPKVVYFSDQPKRDYGTIDNTQFIHNWKLSNKFFKKNPPNVLINYFDPSKNKNHEIKTGIFILFNPSYNKKSRTVSYNAQQIAGSPIKNTYQYYPVIFIDDAKGTFHNCVRAMHCPL